MPKLKYSVKAVIIIPEQGSSYQNKREKSNYKRRDGNFDFLLIDNKDTQKDNTGEKNGKSILSESQVKTIRYIRTKGAAVSDIAREFGLAKSSIYGILNRRNWKHI